MIYFSRNLKKALLSSSRWILVCRQCRIPDVFWVAFTAYYSCPEEYKVVTMSPNINELNIEKNVFGYIFFGRSYRSNETKTCGWGDDRFMIVNCNQGQMKYFSPKCSNKKHLIFNCRYSLLIFRKRKLTMLFTEKKY